MDAPTPRITRVDVLAGRTVVLTFQGVGVRSVDLTGALRGPVFAAIARDDKAFAEVRVDREMGTICWPNGADLDPTVLYERSVPYSPPAARRPDNPSRGRSAGPG